MLYFVFFLSGCHCLLRTSELNSHDLQINEQMERYFDQPIDHSDLSSKTFKQRYYFKKNINSKSVLSKSKLNFLYIGGEGELSYSSISKGFVDELAFYFNADAYGLEHRYYGKSHPYHNLTLAALKHLNIDQSIRDIHNFVNELGLSNVLLIGGSYSATLAAYTKINYPDVFIGAYSSSPPLEAKRDFFEYDLMIQKAIGPKCLQQVDKLKVYVDREYEQGNIDKIKKLFKCKNIDDDYIFLFTLADLLSHLVQYNNPSRKSPGYSELCSKLISKEESSDFSRLEIMSDFYNNVLKNLNQTWVEFSGYEDLKKEGKVEPKDAARQWNYQCCTEFGFWQTAPKTNNPTNLSARSKYLTVENIEKVYCGNKVYGKEIGPPNTKKINNKYPREHLTLFKKIMVVNGGLDPWSILSITNTNQSTFATPIILNQKGSHCRELSTPNETDSEYLKETRQRIYRSLDFWFAELKP